MISAATCNLRQVLPLGCVCNDRNVTCTEVWPNKDHIPQGVVSLTITGCSGPRTLGTSNDTFGELKQLEVLNLTSNTIIGFKSASSFHHRQLPVLRELILDGNNLTMTHHQVFNGLSNLEVLSLKNAFNNSRKVFSDLNITFTRSSFQSLRELYLDDNNFGLLGKGLFLFDGGKESIVQKISLRNCSLIALTDGIFQKKFTPELSVIDLSENKIMYIDNEVHSEVLADFDAFGRQLTLDLTNNTFSCDCDLEPFRTWLNQTSVNLVEKQSLTCDTARNSTFVGDSIVSLNSNNLECEYFPIIETNQMKLPYIILSIIFGVIGLLFLIIMYMRREEIGLWIITTATAIKEVFCSSKAGYSDIGRVSSNRTAADRDDMPVKAPPPPAEV